MHYSMLIQSSPTNGTFEWINPYKYRNSTITSITVLFTPNQIMFNNVDTTNVVTNTNDEERMIPPDYYTFGGGHLQVVGKRLKTRGNPKSPLYPHLLNESCPCTPVN